MNNDKDTVITWAQFNNIVPIVFTIVSVVLSVALFWYQIKLEMSEIKGELKLTNQNISQLTESINKKFVQVDTNSKEISGLSLRITAIESEQKTLHNIRQ